MTKIATTSMAIRLRNETAQRWPSVLKTCDAQNLGREALTHTNWLV